VLKKLCKFKFSSYVIWFVGDPSKNETYTIKVEKPAFGQHREEWAA